jgi:hypothetical protein
VVPLRTVAPPLKSSEKICVPGLGGVSSEVRVKLVTVPVIGVSDLAMPMDVMFSSCKPVAALTSTYEESVSRLAYQVAVQLPVPPVVSNTIRMSTLPPLVGPPVQSEPSAVPLVALPRKATLVPPLLSPRAIIHALPMVGLSMKRLVWAVLVLCPAAKPRAIQWALPVMPVNDASRV